MDSFSWTAQNTFANFVCRKIFGNCCGATATGLHLFWHHRTEKPVVLQGIAGFSICLEEKLPSRKPIQKPIPIDFEVLIHITPDQLFSKHL